MHPRLPSAIAGLEVMTPGSLSPGRHDITADAFSCLLKWLDPDTEEAGRKYENIRRKLIKIFASRCCPCPEELADETIDRVMGRIEQIAPGYRGDPALYFYGVARNVWREQCKARRCPDPPPQSEPDDAREEELECLERCMSHLLPKNREMLLEYYGEEKHAKIDHRRRLALRLGLDMNALRIRLHRIRSSLGECVRSCMTRQIDAGAAPGGRKLPGPCLVPPRQHGSRPS